MLEAVETSLRHDMAGVAVDPGAALALAQASGVSAPVAGYLIGQAARGISAGLAEAKGQ